MTNVLSEMVVYVQTGALGPVFGDHIRTLTGPTQRAAVEVIVGGIRDLEAAKPQRFGFCFDPGKPFAGVVRRFIEASPALRQTVCIRDGKIAYAVDISAEDRLACATVVRARPSREIHITSDP